MLLARQMTRQVITGTIVAGMVLTAVPPATPMFARGTNSVGQVVARAAHPCLVVTVAGDSPFTRNFNPFGFANDPNLDKGAIYQTLYIFTIAGGGHRYPMLATRYHFSRDARTLTITLRKGVNWSDGKSFTSRDVVFTLWIGPRRNKHYDQIGVPAPDSSIASIKAVGPYGVVVDFSKPDVVAAEALLSTPFIIPEHIWSRVPDPSQFTNPDPVGTGPFTQVKRFNQLDYVLGKNPYFWMQGKPAVPCVERVYASGSESIQMQLIKGDID